jgi:hypothetical protein
VGIFPTYGFELTQTGCKPFCKFHFCSLPLDGRLLSHPVGARLGV